MLEQTIEYRAYTINVMHDETPLNPWADCDGEPPLLVYMPDYGMGSVEELGGHGIDSAGPFLTDDVVRKHWREIFEYVGSGPVNFGGLRAFAREESPGYGGLIDALRECMSEWIANTSGRDKIDAIEAMYRWAGIPTYSRTVRGYVQGDWAYVLAVATPEWSETTGAPGETHENQLKGAVDLYEAWAFGNVYGYSVLSPDGNEVDSCWGFFSEDLEASGLLAAARETVDDDAPRYVEHSAAQFRARAAANTISASALCAGALHIDANADVERDESKQGAWVQARVFVSDANMGR